MRKRCSYDIREGHLAIYFLPSSSYTFYHHSIQSHRGHSPPYTHSQHYLLVVSLSIPRSPRGAHVLANPNSACAVLCRWFSAFSCISLRALYVGDAGEVSDAAPRSTVALPARAHEDHEEVPRPVWRARIAMLDGTLRSFAQINGRFLHKRHCWPGGNFVVGSIRADTTF